MDEKQLRHFLSVVEAGSFTGAAKKLYITTPGVVKIVDKLEEELGVQLFVRMRTGVTLTPAGHEMLRYAYSYIQQTELIMAEVRRAETKRENRIEVCMTWGLLSFFPHDFLSKFILMNPDVQLSAHNFSLADCERQLLTCRSGISLHFGSTTDPSIEPVFHRQSHLVALMAEDHPLISKGTLTASDLGDYKIIIVNSDPGVTQNLVAQLAAANCEVQIMLDGSEWMQVLDLVRNAEYVTFCLPPRAECDGLAVRKIADLDVKVNFNMSALQNVHLSEAEQRFADYVIHLMTGGKKE